MYLKGLPTGDFSEAPTALLGPDAAGMTVPPELAIGDGALGFWAAPREVFPDTRAQRCWGHKTANVLGAMPKFLHETPGNSTHIPQPAGILVHRLDGQLRFDALGCHGSHTHIAILGGNTYI
ncbi:hypothetical protein CCR78_03885 [Rhodovulum imhoffii]|nr:hypothetical protein [Rhodovulum imhoffii]